MSALLILVCAASSFTVCSTAHSDQPLDAADDAAEMVLSASDNGTRFAWELKYGLARQMALEFLTEGETEKALQAARMQFILCPPDGESVSAAVRSVTEVLVAADGNDARAARFEAYSVYGPAGVDGRIGTADDLSNPIADVRLTVFERDRQRIEAFDKSVDDLASVCATWEKEWYETKKAFARLDCGDFEGAARILIAVLVTEVKVPHANDDENWELQRIQDIIDRIGAGLGVCYKARNGTTAGMSEFIKACADFAAWGPAGRDNRMGTADDLKAPI